MRTVLLLVTLWAMLFSFFMRAPLRAHADSTNLDVIVVIDNSGSMHSKISDNKVKDDDFGKGSDRHGLRYDATNMLVELLDANDRLSVVHFSETTHILGPDQTMRRLDMKNRGDVKQELTNIAVDHSQSNTNLKKDPKGYGYIKDEKVLPARTQYNDAFNNGVIPLLANKSNNRQAVIFLTDGAPTDMGKTENEITNSMQSQLKKAGVPVFLLMLQNPNEQSQTEISAVKKAFALQNQKVIDIANANDIAYALVSVLTYLKPDLYLDVLRGTADTGVDQTIFEPQISARQQISAATFIFASNSEDSKSFKVTDKDSADSTALPPKSTRFRTFEKSLTDGKDMSWTFTANANVADMTSFVLMRSSINLYLRYPNALNTNSQIMAYPRDTAHVLGISTNIVSADRDKISFEATTGCDATNPVPDQSISYSPLSTGLDTDVIWTKANPSNTDLYFNVKFQPSNNNKGVTLRRCFVLRPTDNTPRVTITEPTIDTPKVENGQLDVAFDLDAPSVVTSTVTLFYGMDGQSAKSVPIDKQKNPVEIQQAGTYNVAVLVEGTVDNRPIVLYVGREIIPQFACNFERISDNKSFNLGSISDTNPVDLSITCDTKASNGGNPSDISNVQLLNESNMPISDDVHKYVTSSAVTTKNGQTTWPMTLTNVSQLQSGTYTLSFDVTVNGTKSPLKYTFVRPKSVITLSWDGYQDEKSILDLGTLTADKNVLVHCISVTSPTLAPDAKLTKEVTIASLYTDNTKIQNTNQLSATIEQNNMQCPDAYALNVVFSAPLTDAMTYTVDLNITATDAQVQVHPQLLHARFTTAPLQANITFGTAIAGPVDQTYQIDVQNASGDVLIPYTVSLAGGIALPSLAAPQVNRIEKRDPNSNDLYDVNAYWADVPMCDKQQCTGNLVLTNVPRITDTGGEYDIVVDLNDPHIQPQQVAFRITTTPENVDWMTWLLIGVIVLLLLRLFFGQGNQKVSSPPAAKQ